MALYNNPQQIAEVVNTLETVKPPVIIYNHLDELDFQRDLRFLEARRQRFDYRLHGIEALLKREYVLSGHLQNMEVFQRRDSLNLP